MKDLPPGLRRYLWAFYLLCLGLVGTQVWLFLAAPWPLSMGEGAIVFVILAYAGERTRLQVSGSTSQTLASAVHIAIILLFPPPFPFFITLLGALVSQIIHERSPLFKRGFNIFHPTVAVGVTAAVLALFSPSRGVLRPGQMVSSIPILALLVALYYVLDVGSILGVLSFAQGQAPWRIWWQMYRRTLLPELALSTIGILAAVSWRFDHILLVLFVLPVVALGVAFRAIAAEDRAMALRRRSEQLEIVLSTGQHLRLQHSQVDLLQAVAQAARVVAGASAVAAYLRDAEDPAMLERVTLVTAEAVVPSPGEAGPIRLLAPPPGQGLQATAMGESGQLLLLPLEPDGMGVSGLLRLAGVQTGLADADLDTLAILATQATIALENAHLHERALVQASEDGLTGLLNHRTFQVRLQHDVDRARQDGHALCLIMVDLDDFGTINNTYGHQAGDAALKAIAAILHSSTRDTDVVARYGGDEFAIILPQTAMDEALAIAERTHAAIAACTVIEGRMLIRIGASLGVAALPRHAYTREELIHAADQAAYAAKHSGKDRVGRPEDASLPLDRDPDVLASQLANANLATVEALAAAVDAKDAYTRGHSQRVSAYAASLARAMNLDTADIKRVQLAGLLHDVGKIGIPDAILTKPGTLRDEEVAIIEEHPIIGERMLMSVPFLREILPAVRHHHERWNGQGYPDGLAGAAIPLDATILMVADAFDAMTTSRIYRPALPLSEAQRRIQEGSGTQFSPRVVAAFEQAMADGAIAVPPPGSIVPLSREQTLRAS